MQNYIEQSLSNTIPPKSGSFIAIVSSELEIAKRFGGEELYKFEN